MSSQQFQLFYDLIMTYIRCSLDRDQVWGVIGNFILTMWSWIINSDRPHLPQRADWYSQHWGQHPTVTRFSLLCSGPQKITKLITVDCSGKTWLANWTENQFYPLLLLQISKYSPQKRKYSVLWTEERFECDNRVIMRGGWGGQCLQK